MHPLAIVGIVVGSLLGLCLIGGVVIAVAGQDDQPGTNDNAAPSAGADNSAPAEPGDDQPEEDLPGIGDPARDGKFEFVVTEIETGIESVGDEFLGKDEINPGNQVDGIVVFDIPEDAVPASLRLHDSFLSGGVEVALG
jgi:hypothetical protein